MTQKLGEEGKIRERKKEQKRLTVLMNLPKAKMDAINSAEEK